MKLLVAVGIAGGRRKTAAIRGALLGRWINVFITDRATAERLLRAAPDPNRDRPVPVAGGAKRRK